MVLRRVLHAYTRALHRRPYATQIASGGALWCAGDLLCQWLTSGRGAECESAGGFSVPPGSADGKLDTASSEAVAVNTIGHSAATQRFRPDWNRVARMTLYGVCISAPAYAFWYSFLDRVSHRVFSAAGGAPLRWLSSLCARPQTAALVPAAPVQPSAASAYSARPWRIIGFKLAMDTLLFDPAYLALFFGATTVLEAPRTATLDDVAAKIRAELLRTWAVDVAVWAPIQTANFRFVPVPMQALVVQSCNVGWNAYLSYVQHSH